MNVWDYFDDSITADEALPKPTSMLNTLLERNGLTMERDCDESATLSTY